MSRKLFQSRIDAKIATLENEREKLEELAGEVDEKIQRLRDVRDDPSFDFLLDVFIQPTAKPGKKTVVIGWPSGKQFHQLLAWFQSNNNAWTPTADVAAQTGLATHTVRQLAYARHPELIERRKKDGAIQIRLRGL